MLIWEVISRFGLNYVGKPVLTETSLLCQVGYNSGHLKLTRSVLYLVKVSVRVYC